MKKNLYIIAIVVCITITTISLAKAESKKYTLNIITEEKVVNGNKIKQFFINGFNYAPTIKANQGDVLKITINNNSSKDMVMHWHGVIVPNSEDGVAGLTQPIIKANSSYNYTFVVKQTGTYWYHAHGFEEAEGLYGGIIFNDNQNSIEEGSLLLYAGTLDKTPENIFKTLKPISANSAINMHSHHNLVSSSNNTEEMKYQHQQDLLKVPNLGMSNHKLQMQDDSHHEDMLHFSDVIFYQHTINGKVKEINIAENAKKQQVKLRIINTYVDGFLNFVYSGGNITIIASDGIDVRPVKVKNLRIAMGETYDILLDIPNKNKSYELVSFILGTNEYTKAILGQGERVKLFSYDENDYSEVHPYAKLESNNPDFINFIATNNGEFNFNWSLLGGHEKYDWYISDNATNKSVSEIIMLPIGVKVKIKIKNNTMMPHPMHLHGMFFKVANAEYNLIKHTYNLYPAEVLEMEFVVDAEGKWLFHCHNLFHMASGMMVTLSVVK